VADVPIQLDLAPQQKTIKKLLKVINTAEELLMCQRTGELTWEECKDTVLQKLHSDSDITTLRTTKAPTKRTNL
jgi:hypothetical protein